MDFQAVLKAVQLAGAAAPAFKELFEQVLPLFSSNEQEELKSAYAVAREKSDAAHQALQDEAERFD